MAPSEDNYPSMVPSPNTIILDVRASAFEFWGDTIQIIIFFQLFLKKNVKKKCQTHIERVKEYNEHPFIIHPNATIVTIFLYLLYYLVRMHTHMQTYLQNHLKIGLDVICIVSDHWSLRIRALSYITTISLSHLKVNSDATVSITHGGFQAHKLFVLLERWSLISLPLWAGWSGSLPVTGICQKWWSNLTLEIGLWKHRGFCLRYTLLNSLESLLLREARCYMGGHSGRQLHGPGAQELRPITYHMSETGCESSFSWILRW